MYTVSTHLSPSYNRGHVSCRVVISGMHPGVPLVEMQSDFKLSPTRKLANIKRMATEMARSLAESYMYLLQDHYARNAQSLNFRRSDWFWNQPPPAQRDEFEADYIPPLAPVVVNRKPMKFYPGLASRLTAPLTLTEAFAGLQGGRSPLWPQSEEINTAEQEEHVNDDPEERE